MHSIFRRVALCTEGKARSVVTFSHSITAVGQLQEAKLSPNSSDPRTRMIARLTESNSVCLLWAVTNLLVVMRQHHNGNLIFLPSDAVLHKVPQTMEHNPYSATITIFLVMATTTSIQSVQLAKVQEDPATRSPLGCVMRMKKGTEICLFRQHVNMHQESVGVCLVPKAS